MDDGDQRRVRSARRPARHQDQRYTLSDDEFITGTAGDVAQQVINSAAAAPPSIY